MRLTQGRFYFVSNDSENIDCFDYVTNARCANFPTNLGVSFNGIYATRIDPNNPSCIWINSNGGVIRVVDAFSGQLGCSANPVITLQPSSFAPRFTCTTPNSIDEWRVLELTSLAGSGTPSTIALTVRDALGATVTGWVNRPITVGTPLDMTGLDVTLSGSRPTFNFAFGGVTGGSITNATIALDYAGKGPELCIDATLHAGAAVCPVLTGLDGALIDSVPNPDETFAVRREFTIGTDINLCPEDIQPMTVPSVPRNLVGSAGHTGGGSITFVAPADDGGSPLREYKLSLDGGTTWTTPTVIDNGNGTYTVTLTGLTPGDTYPLELKATNLMGRSVSATLSLLVSLAPPPNPEIDVDIPLEPGTPSDGAPIEIGGNDLKPNTTIEVKLYPGGIVVGTATTDGDGNFVLDITLPDGMDPGSHELRLEGTGPDDAPFTSSKELFVDWSGSIADVTPTTGGYHPLSPVRVLDTRLFPAAKVRAGTEQRVAFPEELLPADVNAVAFNLTVTEPEKSGYLTAHVCGSALPSAASLNFTAGETTANLVESVIRDGQELCVFSMVNAHVVVDVAGYHSDSATELLTAREPKRLADTRLTQRVQAGETLVVPVIGDGLAPAGTEAAYLDLAVTTPEGSGFLTVFPCGTERPWASTLNYSDGDLASNSAIAKVGADGTVCVYTLRTTDIVVDLTGTFSTSGTGRFAGFVSGRMEDTRVATKLVEYQTLEVTVVGDGATPAGTSAVALNIGVDSPERAGFLTVWPCGTERPWSSALDFKAGETVSNHVTATPGANGKICIYTMATTDVVVDIEGIYWAAPVT